MCKIESKQSFIEKIFFLDKQYKIKLKLFLIEEKDKILDKLIEKSVFI